MELMQIVFCNGGFTLIVLANIIIWNDEVFVVLNKWGKFETETKDNDSVV